MRMLSPTMAVAARAHSIKSDFAVSLQALIDITTPENERAKVPRMVVPFVLAMRTKMMKHELAAVRQTYGETQERAAFTRVWIQSERS